MTNTQILHADLLDILFENRNKSYGAYELRKNYARRLSAAVMISLALAAIFFGLQSLVPNRSIVERDIPRDSIKIRPIAFVDHDPKDDNNNRQVRRKPSAEKQIQYTNRIKIVPDEERINMPEQEALASALTGTMNIDGDEPDDPAVSGQPVTTQPGSNSFQPTDERPVLPNREAHFPGGEKSWLDFLSKNLNSPGLLEADERIVVHVKFDINEDGALSNFQIVKSGGKIFDREVLRVMRKMPPWEPAIQNGRKVKVSFMQPVVFVAME